MTCRLAAIALALLLPAAAAAQTNLVADGGFDDPTLAAWGFAIFDGSTIDWSSLDVADAPTSGSLRVEEDGDSGPANSVFAVQALPVVPGATYTFSGRYRYPSTTMSGSPLFRLNWRPSYGLGDPRPFCEGAILDDDEFFAFSSVLEEWHTAELADRVAPPGAFCVTLELGAKFADPGQTTVVHWDDARVAPEPGSSAAGVAASALLAAMRRRRYARPRHPPGRLTTTIVLSLLRSRYSTP